MHKTNKQKNTDSQTQRNPQRFCLSRLGGERSFFNQACQATSGLQLESHSFEIILIAQCVNGLGDIAVGEKTLPWLTEDSGGRTSSW